MKNEKKYKILKIINDSFGVDNYNFDDSCLNQIDEIIKILDLKDNLEFYKVGHGSYSCVYQMKDKVIKIGMSKLNKNIINHFKIVEVFFKDNIKIIKDNNKITVGIEIQRFALPNTSDNVDELYDIYKCLRDDGIMWCDVKIDNTGYVDSNLVVVDTDDCYLVNNANDAYVNDIARKFEICYNENKEDLEND